MTKQFLAAFLVSCTVTITLLGCVPKTVYVNEPLPIPASYDKPKVYLPLCRPSPVDGGVTPCVDVKTAKDMSLRDLLWKRELAECRSALLSTHTKYNVK